MNDWTQLAIVISAIGVIIGAFLRHMSRKDDRTEATISYIVDKHAIALEKLGDESEERSQSMEVCIRQSHELSGKAMVMMDKAAVALEKSSLTLEEHKAILQQIRQTTS
jgi:cation transport regulator ChaC